MIRPIACKTGDTSTEFEARDAKLAKQKTSKTCVAWNTPKGYHHIVEQLRLIVGRHDHVDAVGLPLQAQDVVTTDYLRTARGTRVVERDAVGRRLGALLALVRIDLKRHSRRRLVAARRRVGAVCDSRWTTPLGEVDRFDVWFVHCDRAHERW